MTLHHGDCLEVMAGLEPESVDAVVTDPPYGINFMGKAWDGAAIAEAARADAANRKSLGPHSESRPGRSAPRSSSAFGSAAHYAGPVSGGKPWQDWCEAWAQAAYRVAKPSAYLLAFGGTRTVHRLTSAIEDAGWIIRDLLSWNYASGFPKSKASLKPAWEPIIWARKPFRVPLESWGEVHHALAALIWLVEGAPQGDGCASMRVASLFDGNDRTATSASRAVASTSSSIALSWGGILAAALGDGSRFTTSTATRLTIALRTLNSCLSPVTSAITMPRCACLVDGSLSSASIAASGSSAEHTSTLDTLRRSVPESAIGPLAQSVAAVCASLADDLSDDLGVDVTALGSATTEAAERAELRPIVMARKPGPLRMLAIDECRIGYASAADSDAASVSTVRTEAGRNKVYGRDLVKPGAVEFDAAATGGRWPANVILTATDDGRAIFDGGWEGVVGGRETASGSRTGEYGGSAAWSGEYGPVSREVNGDSGTYSRFFVLPKADRADREPVLGGLPERVISVWGGDEDDLTPGKKSTKPRTNLHPTVKPVDLMRHLVRLVTPTGGTVLDPFAGSGSTLIAAEMEGFAWIGIEKEAEYVAIAEARLNGTQRGLGLTS